jgi:hypothetical protein
MKIGLRTPSFKMRIAARTSPKRMFRAKARAPKGFGWVTNPKNWAYYNSVCRHIARKACYIATAVYGDPNA